MDQREMALVEQRNRIVNAAKAVYTIRMEMNNGIDIQLTIENIRTEEIEFDAVRTIVTDYFKQNESAAKTFEVLCDDVYLKLAAKYSERDIEVQIVNNFSGLAFTKIYNTHKPHLSTAI